MYSTSRALSAYSRIGESMRENSLIFGKERHFVSFFHKSSVLFLLFIQTKRARATTRSSGDIAWRRQRYCRRKRGRTRRKFVIVNSSGNFATTTLFFISTTSTPTATIARALDSQSAKREAHLREGFGATTRRAQMGAARSANDEVGSDNRRCYLLSVRSRWRSTRFLSATC